MRELLRLCRRTAASLRDRGVRATVEAVIATMGHYWFDVRHGTSTAESAVLAPLRISSPNKRHGVSYSASKPRVFDKLMERVHPSPGSVFVDLGAGKGRVLLMAAKYGFKRIVGVEFSPELCQSARAKIAAYRQRTKTRAEFEIIEADVVDYRMRDDENVFFLFNPFDAVVMGAVLERIESSCRRNPRTIWLVYCNAFKRDAIERRGTFARVAEVVYAGAKGEIYVSQGSQPMLRSSSPTHSSGLEAQS